MRLIFSHPFRNHISFFSVHSLAARHPLLVSTPHHCPHRCAGFHLIVVASTPASRPYPIPFQFKIPRLLLPLPPASATIISLGFYSFASSTAHLRRCPHHFCSPTVCPTTTAGLVADPAILLDLKAQIPSQPEIPKTPNPNPNSLNSIWTSLEFGSSAENTRCSAEEKIARRRCFDLLLLPLFVFRHFFRSQIVGSCDYSRFRFCIYAMCWLALF